MPSIKVRVLDTASEAEDADPYVCFRRREVRQTRKTRGRDAQVVEKLKKLRLELEQARQLVQMVVQREQLNKEQLEMSRKVFEQRSLLKKVKIEKNIIGDKGDDEELLLNHRTVAKPKPRQDNAQQRPATIRLRTTSEKQAPDNDLVSLADLRGQDENAVQQSIEGRKKQHIQWNQHWIDRTWDSITPPPEEVEVPPRWAPLLPSGFHYPSPPPSLPSQTSQEKDGDVEMSDDGMRFKEEMDVDASAGAEAALPDYETQAPALIFQMPGSWPPDFDSPQPSSDLGCRLRYGRGGRRFLEARRRQPRAILSRAVVSDSDSDDDGVPEFCKISEQIAFEYRCLMARSRAEGMDRRMSNVSTEGAVAQGATQQQQSHHQQASTSQVASNAAG